MHACVRACVINYWKCLLWWTGGVTILYVVHFIVIIAIISIYLCCYYTSNVIKWADDSRFSVLVECAFFFLMYVFYFSSVLSPLLWLRGTGRCMGQTGIGFWSGAKVRFLQKEVWNVKWRADMPPIRLGSPGKHCELPSGVWAEPLPKFNFVKSECQTILLPVPLLWLCSTLLSTCCCT